MNGTPRGEGEAGKGLWKGMEEQRGLHGLCRRFDDELDGSGASRNAPRATRDAVLAEAQWYQKRAGRWTPAWARSREARSQIPSGPWSSSKSWVKTPRSSPSSLDRRVIFSMA